MLLLKSIREHQDRSVMRKALTYVHFHFAKEFNTLTLAYKDDSLVRVTRRATNDHYASIIAKRNP